MDDSIHFTLDPEPRHTPRGSESEPQPSGRAAFAQDHGFTTGHDGIDHDHLTTGHDGIDHDHLMMLELVNNYEDAVRTCQADRAVAQVLCDLATYAAGHFEREELLMRRLRYPEAQAHRIEHDGFLASLGNLVDAYEAGHPGLPEDTLAFLRRWLTEHLIGWDQRLVAFVKANRLCGTSGDGAFQRLPDA